MSASLHGADDLDPVALGEGCGRPGVAPHHRAVERDGEAFRAGQLECGGFGAPQLGEIAARAHALLTVDVEPHGSAPWTEGWAQSGRDRSAWRGPSSRRP